MPTNNVDWYFIIDQIHQKKCTPVISNQIIIESLFSDDSLMPAWADSINYPLTDQYNLTRIAQFLSVTQQDPVRAKSNYLHFLKRSLLNLAQQNSEANQNFLSLVRNELRSLTFSQLATERLYLPNFKEELDHPLSILAALDVPIYLTTSHHTFIEAALRAVGKTPRTEVYAWQEGMEDNLPAEFKTNLNFDPEVQTPLVYHWHGLDAYPDSLVLTEDDHLEFLVNVTQDLQEPGVIPSSVRNALSSSLLLLLGYDLHAWDLRVMLQGLIKGKPRRPRSFAIQIIPESQASIKSLEHFQEYLHKYFGQVRFDVYWGDVQSFMQTLWAEWEAG